MAKRKNYGDDEQVNLSDFTKDKDKEEIKKLLKGDKAFEADPAAADVFVDRIVEDSKDEELPEEAGMFKPGSFDDDYESGGLLTGSQYEVPEAADAFVDTGSGKVINKEDLTPFEIIKAIAKQNNHDIHDPKPSCNKCYGRGYEGMDSQTKMPIPCRCLFRGKSETEKMRESFYDAQRLQGRVNRAMKRRMARALAREFRRMKKSGMLKKAEKKVEEEKISTATINKVLNQYVGLKSIRKTAGEMKLSITKTKRILKENRKKLEKMFKKAEKEKK